jgi:uncharacterized membrane protein YciS (DUF1049 family)
MWLIRAIFIAVIVIALVAFAFYNISPTQTVDVNLILGGWQYTNVPLITVVFWAFVAGVAVSLVLFVSVFVKQSVENRSARKRIRALEHEVTVLRNRPIEESADLLKDSEVREGQTPSPFTEN